MSDITYIRTTAGWLYLTTIIDLCDRQVIGWPLSTRMHTNQTIIPAWKMAVSKREITESLLFHCFASSSKALGSDRGIQYASIEFRKLINKNTLITQSMSRKANCWDNAVAESFFKTLKAELIYQHKFTTMGGYNALLSLFNITAEEVKGERDGQTVNGLVYVALDENGNKVSNPFKASLFGKDAGVAKLQKHFEQSKEKMKSNSVRSALRNAVELAIHTTGNEMEFKKQLVEQGINTVVRRNNEERIYGMTFIDHESRTVWNGSQLDRNLSANVFNDWWNNGNKPELETQDNPVLKTNTIDNQPTKGFFEFIPQEHSQSSDLGLFSLLPDAQGEGYEEEQFANSMKKKKKGRRL